MRKINKNKFKYIIRVLIFLIAIAVIAVSFTKLAFIAYDKLTLYDERIYNATFEISRIGGLAVDTDVLNFGAAPKGGASAKDIVIYHEYKNPVRVEVFYIGNISKVLAHKEPVLIEPYTNSSINLIAYAKADYGGYSGKVILKLYKT